MLYFTILFRTCTLRCTRRKLLRTSTRRTWSPAGKPVNRLSIGTQDPDPTFDWDPDPNADTYPDPVHNQAQKQGKGKKNSFTRIKENDQTQAN